MILNCIIIDDEPLAANLLTSYARKIPFLNLIGTYNSAIEAIKDLKENDVKLVFLDIQMPELSGIEFAKIVSKDTKVIFTTAFDKYALEGYRVNALDYLIKPIEYKDFLNASNKALEYFSTIRRNTTFSKDRFVYVKSDYKLVQIDFDDILYFEGMKDYVRIYLEGGNKPITSLLNLKRLETILPYPEFMRIHRSYIIHMSKVKLVDSSRFVFGETLIPIAESYKDKVQQYFEAHSLGGGSSE